MRFTSDRERRLWLSLLIVVVAIYSTLGFAGSLAGSMRSQDMNALTFVVGVLLVVVAVTTQMLGNVSRWELFITAGVAAVLVLVVTRLTSPVERSHLVEYAVVATLLYGALSERRRNGRHVPNPAVVAVAITILIGTVDELVQIVVPNRVFDPIDIGFNAGAAVMAVAAGTVLAWNKRRRVQLRSNDRTG
ncbi:MAG: VanZ family protein [Armatimonadetes bacterium]|nr:MAG: VanZ family protein [Armatimonadota bacterium]